MATYINGDKVEYTGNTEMLHGDLAHEVVFVEGHKAGQIATTYRAPGNVGNYNGEIGNGAA